MSFRTAKNDSSSRARSPEDKAKVREAFLAAGRKLFSEEDPAQVSLRRIAAEAGYAPAAIYKYFSDQQDLFFHIRAHDQQAATDDLRRVIATVKDPAKRVQKLFIASSDYWLTHMDHFTVVCSPRLLSSPAPVPANGVPFGRSPYVQESNKLHYDTVDQLFSTFERPPMSSRLATDMLMASVYGTIAFSHMTRTMEWSDTRTMIKKLVETILKQWIDSSTRTPKYE